MVVTLGQQYNVGEKSPDIILYTYINRHVGTPEKQQKQKQCIVCSTSIIKHGRSSIMLHSRLYTVKTKPLFLFSFSFVSLIADGPHHYHPACGHKGSSHLSPVHALHFFYRDATSALLQLVNQWLNFTYSRSHAFRYERKNTNPIW